LEVGEASTFKVLAIGNKLYICMYQIYMFDVKLIKHANTYLGLYCCSPKCESITPVNPLLGKWSYMITKKWLEKWHPHSSRAGSAETGWCLSQSGSFEL